MLSRFRRFCFSDNVLLKLSSQYYSQLPMSLLRKFKFESGLRSLHVHKLRLLYDSQSRGLNSKLASLSYLIEPPFANSGNAI